MAELKPGKMPRDTALLHHQSGRDGRAGQYVGSMCVTLGKRKGTAPGVTVLELKRRNDMERPGGRQTGG
jgi:hypothetical protein